MQHRAATHSTLSNDRARELPGAICFLRRSHRERATAQHPPGSGDLNDQVTSARLSAASTPSPRVLAASILVDPVAPVVATVDRQITGCFDHRQSQNNRGNWQGVGMVSLRGRPFRQPAPARLMSVWSPPVWAIGYRKLKHPLTLGMWQSIQMPVAGMRWSQPWAKRQDDGVIPEPQPISWGSISREYLEMGRRLQVY